VDFIRSASYGSVDAGPLGFQCEYSVGSIYHLHDRLHQLEIIDLEGDLSVQNGNIGRMLFTSKVRQGQNIKRYDIGDIGKIISEICQCGRQGTRFELLGRHGDVFRIGTIFLSYQKFQKIFLDKYNFKGVFQLHLYPAKDIEKETLSLWLEETSDVLNSKDMQEIFIQNYPDLYEVVIKDKVLNFSVSIHRLNELDHNLKTAKLKTVIDHR
jgi:phenylacetate-coenzyme A ligase PaaK-like adenylate-forming protein